MGAYLRFDFVERQKDLIVGELPSLKVYEAKLSLVERNYLNNGNDTVSFKWGGYIFSEFEKNANRWEYYQYHIDCYFINLAIILSGTDTRSYDDRTIYLFEPEIIKIGFQNVIEYAKVGGFSDEEAYKEDMRLLRFFYDKINKYESKSVFISCSLS